MAKVAEVEMKLLMGILAGTGPLGFALVVGSEIAEFVVENRENFGKWRDQLKAVLTAREYLKKYAPTTYDKLFNAVYLRFTRTRRRKSLTPSQRRLSRLALVSFSAASAANSLKASFPCSRCVSSFLSN